MASAVALLLGLSLQTASALPPAPDVPATDALAVQAHALLERACFECHGPQVPRPKGGLRLSDRQSVLDGGGSGPAVVPEDPDGSLLIQSVRREQFDTAMPPREELSDDEVALLEDWVRGGASWPEGVVVTTAEAGPSSAGDSATHAPGGPDTGTRALPADPFADVDMSPEQVLWFEQEVRPVLAESCGHCHGADAERLRGELSSASRAGLLRGGASGPAIVPGDAEASLLVQAIRYEDPFLQMPPKAPLADEKRRTLETWIQLGAPWPGGGEDDHRVQEHSGGIDVEAGRRWWSFQPVVRPEPPAAPAGTHPVDAFVDARLAEAGLPPNPPADPRRLLRRATLDLIGLPASRARLDAFAADPSPAAWRRELDRLLADRGFGERWARHWLDLVRYAQTNGYEKDEEKPAAWRYRDWVIDAFNADKPYDQFLRDQLAGDELDQVTDESLVATGFYRLGTWDAEPDDGRQALFDGYDDILRTVGEGMLGVTLGCARCHDHKFDPIGQRDYYSMLAFFRGVAPYEKPVYGETSDTLAPLGLTEQAVRDWERDRLRERARLEAERRELLAVGAEKALQQSLAAAPEAVRAAYLTPEDERDEAQRALLAEHPDLGRRTTGLAKVLDPDQRRRATDLALAIQQLDSSFEGDLDWALVVSERSPRPLDTQVLLRGLASRPGETVEPQFVRALCASDEDSLPGPIPPPADLSSSGRRRALAEWITAPDNPLTARVMVNRVWQQLFGQGLVATPNDFGATGSPPSHPALLDWLAAEFVDSGWSVKHLLRRIMTSAAYRRSSLASGPGVEQDPGNALLWRQDLRRLEAEAIRDAVLAVSGELDRKAGGRGFFPELSWQAMASASRPGEGWRVDPEAERNRRSIYGFVKRGQPVPLLEALDYTDTTAPVGRRLTTTIVSQAFSLLNGSFMNRQAAALAARVADAAGPGPVARVRRMFETVLAREPSREELELGLELLATQRAGFARGTPLVSFQQAVPGRAGIEFLRSLRGPDVLRGPESGWSFLRGPWGNAYNMTHELDVARGPAALVQRLQADDLSLQARLSVDGGAGFASLLLRAERHGPVFTGVEVMLDPRDRAVRVLLHTDETPGYDTTAPPELLAAADAELARWRWWDVRVEARGPSVRVFLGDAREPVLSVEDERLVGGGAVGLRTWGGTVELSRLAVTHDGLRQLVSIPDVDADQRALEALALTLLNLNEFVYVD